MADKEKAKNVFRVQTVTAGIEETMAGLAQGAINIDEGVTTIEAGSRVHLAMRAIIANASLIKEKCGAEWMERL